MDETLSLPQPISLSLDDIRRGNSDPAEVVTDLYVKLRPALVSYVYHLTGSSRDAEDVVQIAFLQLFDRLNEKTEIHNIRGWIYRVVHNIAIDDVRQTGRRQTIFKKWFPDYESQIDDKTAEDALLKRELIERALAMLNEREQRCLMLRAEGLSYQEIAEVLEISAKSVSVYLARGLKKFESRNED